MKPLVRPNELENAIMKQQTYKVAASIIGVFIFTSSTLVSAEEHWRWKDEHGIVHYGTAPPVGVEAERVSNYGSSEFAKDKAATKEAPKMSEALIQLRKERCLEEKQRLAYFGQSKVIRMKMPDGTTKTMTPDEIQNEKNISNKIIAKNCDENPPS